MSFIKKTPTRPYTIVEEICNCTIHGLGIILGIAGLRFTFGKAENIHTPFGTVLY